MGILVTGASGFVGSNLVRRLVADGGGGGEREVTALVNRGDIAVPGVRVVRGDITDPDLRLEGGFEVVYHLAAATPLEKDGRVQRQVNVEGTANLFERIRDGAASVVYVSGLGVFGDASGRIIDESTKRDPDTHYAKTRLEAEEYLAKGCGEHSIGFSVAYLGEVYGNGGWFASQLAGRLRRGRFRLPAGGNYHRSFVHVDDAAGALAAMGEGRPRHRSFIVTDSEPAPFRDFVNFAADLMGVRRPGGVPAFVARALLGGDAVRLLTTPVRASNKRISGLVRMRFPTYREGLPQVLSGAGG